MKELKDYIHMYIGCKCTYPDTDPEAPWIVATLTGCTITDGIETTYLEVQKHEHGETHGDYLAWKSNGNHNSDALHLKFILRPLESMTKEEMKQWVMQPDLTDHYCTKKIRDISGSIYGLYGFISFYGNHESIKWLLQKGFDIFGLKEAGLAIYE